MTIQDFNFICKLHKADANLVLKDSFVMKVMKEDTKKQTTFNQITLSTYIGIEYKNTFRKNG